MAILDYTTLTREAIKDLASLQRASMRWYWRLLAIIVTIFTVIGALFQVLSYFKG